MSLDEMAEILSEEPDAVIDNPLVFKMKLDIGEEAYRYLSSAKNLKNFFEITGVGAAASGIAAVGWLSSLGFVGKIGLAVGMVSTPVGWIAAAGAGGAALTFGVKKFFKKTEKATMDNIPKFINTPLDALAKNVAEILLPPSIMIANSDSQFSQEERVCIVEYFFNEWGYNKLFIEKEIEAITENLSLFDLEEYAKQLSKICKKSQELKYDNIRNEILTLTHEIVEADGELRPMEKIMYKQLENAL